MGLLRFLVIFLLGIGAAVGAYATGAVDYLSRGVPLRSWFATETPTTVLRIGSADDPVCPAQYTIDNRSTRRLLVLFTTAAPIGQPAYGGYGDQAYAAPADNAAYSDGDERGSSYDARYDDADGDESYAGHYGSGYDGANGSAGNGRPSYADNSVAQNYPPASYPPPADYAPPTAAAPPPAVASAPPGVPANQESRLVVAPGESKQLGDAWAQADMTPDCAAARPVAIQLTDCRTDPRGVCGNAVPAHNPIAAIIHQGEK